MLSGGENRMILRLLVLTQYQRVTDRWTASTAERDRNVLNLTA